MRAIIKAVSDRLQGKAPLISKKRSPHWHTLQKNFLETNRYCAACGTAEKLQVHHIVPFHVDPSKELDLTNLIALCEGASNGKNCHLHIGHNGNFKKDNPNVLNDAAESLAKSKK